MSASDADGLRGCGRGEASSTAPQPDRAADLRGWSLHLRTGLLPLARRVIARQAPWPMEQRKRAILIRVHPNPHLHIVLPMPALRDLKLKARVAHCVVPPDNPILLNTKDARQVAHKRHERVPRLRRLDRKARVVLGHIDFGQVAVGVRHSVDPGQPQHLRQAALQRAEHPLHPAPSLRAVGRDVLDAELLQRTPDLGQLILIDRLAGLGREEIVTAPIGIERTEQALACDHLAKATQAREGAFLFDQKGRVDLARGVVQRDDQIQWRLPAQPGMGRAVLEQHHPGQRLAHPLLAMRGALRRTPDQPARLQDRLGPGVAVLEALLLEFLVEVLDREIEVAGSVLLDDPLDAVHRRAAGGGSAAAAVDDALCALGVIAVTQTAEMALADAEQFGRLLAAQFTSVPAPDRIDNPGHSYLRQHAIPPALNRTDCVLPNPDISRATDTGYGGYGGVATLRIDGS